MIRSQKTYIDVFPDSPEERRQRKYVYIRKDEKRHPEIQFMDFGFFYALTEFNEYLTKYRRKR